MAKEVVNGRDLLDRWREIEEGDDDDKASSDPIERRRLRQLKEQWFSDTFNFLVYFPKENHIWCAAWDLMGPLLETFYNYYKDQRLDSPLKLLWKRISKEMQQCTQCICQHHQAKEMYNVEYELNSIGPLLDVLQSLDEERITQHLMDINTRIAREKYDPVNNNAEVITVMFEVLVFPVLLDDEALVTQFQIFIEAIDDSHELTLAGQQQYPGVFALLFLKSRRARSIGFRLARCVGKLRRAADLEPLQPLLRKYICFLEIEALPSTIETSRPRAQLERSTVWLGIKALLGFLEPPAFEEGILERYPIFLSIVLNHISDDSVEFSYAVNCLRLLFEMLGCKLWLRATLSPSVMRNTLLGQCFHTRNEKSHKEIFDLFQPFLQSLEALQDGEHEKQRRHLIYFLLHQVTVSCNFSALMRKKACQVALRIIHRGYKMNPPCPPFECAHMWGPSLVSSLKDSSLHSSLRQPAFDLIETIIVCDAAALITSILNCATPTDADGSMLIELKDEDDDEGLLCALDVEEKDTSCWNEFAAQSKITSQEYGCWMCIPMLWFDVLVEIDPSILPISFSKAVFWALSRFSMVESENSTESALPIRNWLTTCAPEISHLFRWKVPSGFDDGGYGKESKNSVKVSTMRTPLIKTFKRLTGHFVVRMEQGELRKQWTWEPRMGESLILLLVDPNDNARQVGRHILEQVSNTCGLACGLQFLCSCSSSLSAILLGLRHALKLVQLDSVLIRFQTLHHLYFVLCKLLKEGNASTQTLSGRSSVDLSISRFSSEGGFLWQPVFDSTPNNARGCSSNFNFTSWEKFCCLLAEISWPSILKCLAEGKAFVDFKISQMTCIRLLEIVPVVYERLHLQLLKKSRNSGMMVEKGINFKWLHGLMDWGKSSIAVVVRYWKQSLVTLLGLVKMSCRDKSALAINTIEKLISCDNVAMDELTEQISRLCILLANDGYCSFRETNLKSRPISFGDLLLKGKCSAQGKEAFTVENADEQIAESTSLINNERENVINLLSEDIEPVENADVQILDPTSLTNKDRDKTIIILDDEMETEPSANNFVRSHPGSSQCLLDFKIMASGAVDTVLQGDLTKENISSFDSSANLSNDFHHTVVPNSTDFVSWKMDSDEVEGRQRSAFSVKSKAVDNVRKESNLTCNSNVSFPSMQRSDLKNSNDESVCSKVTDSYPSQHRCNIKNSYDQILSTGSVDHQCINKVLETNETALKVLVRDAEDNPMESAPKPLRHLFSSVTKPSTLGPKRQVVQLNLPLGSRSSHLHRQDGVKRFRPARLDDWYKPILEINYFATMGLASASEEDNRTVSKLIEVPICFKSPDEYVEVFKPLLLEEFKAQLHSSFMEMDYLGEMHYGCLSVMSVERVDDFNIVRCVHDGTSSAGSKSILENDLILLTRQPLQNSSIDVHVLGKVEKREKDSKRRLNILVIRFYLQNGCSRLNRVRKLLVERSKWYISRLMSITPQLREFQALSSIKDIPLLPTILNPIIHPLGHHKSGKDLSMLSQPLQQILKSSYNDSQLQALSAAIRPMAAQEDFDLSLIQGPPGTGKTRTIVAIVSCLLAVSRINSKKWPQVCGLKPQNTSYAHVRSQISQSAVIARAWQDAALARQLIEDEKKNSESTGSFTRGRVLIGAQSNAAVDELVARISSEGLYDSDGVMYKPYLVRVGNVKTIHPNSLPFFIDTLVDQRLAEKIGSSDSKTDISIESSTVLRSNLEKLVDRIRFYEVKRASMRNGNSDSKCLLELEAASKGDDVTEMSDAEIEAKLRKLCKEKKAIYTDLAAAQAREKRTNEETKALKYKLRKSILREAEIVVATLSGCGGDLYGVCSESFLSHKFGDSSDTLFDAVVIDEAAQALEPASLIPLQLLKSRGTRCIMVGDPKQLPATVLSSIASKYLYQCSMFERLQRAGYPVIMLTKQYRMHPEICRFPSVHFYDGKLLNGELLSSKAAPFHETELLGPYVFFDIVDGQELHGKNSGALSLYNECEADAAVELLGFFRKSYPSEFVGGRIGVITPYKMQLSLLRSRFSSVFGSSVVDEMELNTVDGFQGREVDILVLSTVRAADLSSIAPRINSSNIGFVADVRRMNVALTRAKISLWILGNVRTLQTNQNWAALIMDAKERNLVISVKKPYRSIFKSDLMKNTTQEHSNYHSRSTKHVEEFKAADRHAELQPEKRKNSDKKKRKYIGSGAQSDGRVGGNEHIFSALSEAVQSKKRKDNDKCEFSAKGHSASIVVKNSGNKAAKVKKCANMDDQVTNVERRGKKSTEKQRKIGNADESEGNDRLNLSNKLDYLEQVTGGRHKLLQSATLEGLSESFEHHSRLENLNIGTSSSKRSLQEREGNSRVGNQVDTAKDTITKRKQQRDAIDALLSTALISSKRLETSSKTVAAVRAVSPTTAGHTIKPPKPRNVAPAYLSSADQICQHHCKEKSLTSKGIG